MAVDLIELSKFGGPHQIAGAYVPSPGERVGVLLCGSNTDPSTVAVIPSDQPSA